MEPGMSRSEFRSFSKTSGFTGVRCAFTVIPKGLKGKTRMAAKPRSFALESRHSTKFNGVSYPVQRGAAAIYSPEGSSRCGNLLSFTSQRRLVREALTKLVYRFTAGCMHLRMAKDSGNCSSWAFSTSCCVKPTCVGTPGSGLELRRGLFSFKWPSTADQRRRSRTALRENPVGRYAWPWKGKMQEVQMA